MRRKLRGLEELTASVRQNGILEPLIVRRKQKGKYEIICGHRRLEAAKKAGLKQIPAKIVEVSDKEAFEISLTENVQRKNLASFEEARVFKDYVDIHGYGSVTELAKKIGRDKSYVSYKLRLLDISPKLLRRLNDSEQMIPTARLAEISRLASYDDQEAVFELASTLPSRDLRKIITKMKERNLSAGEAFKEYQKEQGRRRKNNCPDCGYTITPVVICSECGYMARGAESE